MAITLAGSIGSVADSATVTGTYTFSAGANQYLVVAAGGHQNTVGTVTLNGTSLTRTILGTTQFNEQVGMWCYSAPPASSAGTIQIKAASADGVGFLAAEFNGVSQSGQPAGSANAEFGNSSTPKGTLTTSTDNNVTVGAYYSEGGYVSDNAGQTAILQKQAQSFENMALSYLTQSPAGAGTIGWTLTSGQRWAVALVNIEPVSSVAVTSTGFRTLLGVGG